MTTVGGARQSGRQQAIALERNVRVIAAALVIGYLFLYLGFRAVNERQLSRLPSASVAATVVDGTVPIMKAGFYLFLPAGLIEALITGRVYDRSDSAY